MLTKDLVELGLTEAETKIYYSVLKQKNCTVRDISKESGFHRTNIYDILEQLREKGLITIFKEGKTTKYNASDPNNLYDLLKEKKELLDNIFPGLKNLYEQSADEIKVEVYKGDEGMKATYRDILRENKPLYMYGVKGKFRDKLPAYAAQWLRDAKKQKLPMYGIYTKRGNPPSYYTEIRYLKNELSSPVAVFIYGDKININIWDPTLVAIIIKSKLVASMYKAHFDLLWKMAKP